MNDRPLSSCSAPPARSTHHLDPIAAEPSDPVEQEVAEPRARPSGDEHATECEAVVSGQRGAGYDGGLAGKERTMASDATSPLIAS